MTEIASMLWGSIGSEEPVFSLVRQSCPIKNQFLILKPLQGND
jgi:hypothetical protein